MRNIVQKLTINVKSLDVVSGIQNQDCGMVGADESTELMFRITEDKIKKRCYGTNFIQTFVFTIYSFNSSYKFFPVFAENYVKFGCN